MKDKNNLEPCDYTTSVSNTLNQPTIDNKYYVVISKKLLNRTNKKLKAFEIIKKRVIDMDLLFHSDTLQDYNEQVPQYIFGSEIDIDRCLTQKEFDLLKEVLKDEINKERNK